MSDLESIKELEGLTKPKKPKKAEKKEKKVLVYHMNEHSEFMTYRISWEKPKGLMKNKAVYHIDLTEFLKDRISA